MTVIVVTVQTGDIIDVGLTSNQTFREQTQTFQVNHQSGFDVQLHLDYIFTFVFFASFVAKFIGQSCLVNYKI